MSELGNYENAMMEEREDCLLIFCPFFEFYYGLDQSTDIHFIILLRKVSGLLLRRK